MRTINMDGDGSDRARTRPRCARFRFTATRDRSALVLLPVPRQWAEPTRSELQHAIKLMRLWFFMAVGSAGIGWMLAVLLMLNR